MANDLRLTIVAGEGAGRELTVPEAGAVLGRDKQADIVLSEKALSRRHCRIFRQEGRWLLEDLGSRNGTFVNGNRATRAELKGGDIIQLGQTRLTVTVPIVAAVRAGPEPSAAAVPPQPLPQGPPPLRVATQPTAGGLTFGAKIKVCLVVIVIGSVIMGLGMVSSGRPSWTGRSPLGSLGTIGLIIIMFGVVAAVHLISRYGWSGPTQQELEASVARLGVPQGADSAREARLRFKRGCALVNGWVSGHPKLGSRPIPWHCFDAEKITAEIGKLGQFANQFAVQFFGKAEAGLQSLEQAKREFEWVQENSPDPKLRKKAEKRAADAAKDLAKGRSLLSQVRRPTA